MLTGAVNIAVFAVFHLRFDLQSVSTAAFKPCGAIWQRDISRYGWQKRQDRGKKRQRCGNDVAMPAAKAAMFGGKAGASGTSGISMSSCLGLPVGARERFAAVRGCSGASGTR
jgi:hypothetical protein